MSVDRRKFMKIAGLGALGVTASGTAGKLIAEDRGPSHTSADGSLEQETPMTAKRWAMVVDLRKADKHTVHACVEACHKEHNVPTIPDAADEIKWMWEEHFEHVFHDQDIHYAPDEIKHKPTLLLCNHCDNPSCVKVCPTQATWKREEDGIVMMDWHRCIGCRYCIVACPYGSRSFNFRNPREFIEEINPDFPTRMRGVVEKCTFCEERLSRGEIPACVEACHGNGLLTFGDLEDPDSEVSKILRDNFALRRKPALGTQPEVYYIVG